MPPAAAFRCERLPGSMTTPAEPMRKPLDASTFTEFLTLSELTQYDGKKTQQTADGKEEKKIYMSILGLIYDCSENGEQHFGSGGSYAKFAGRDITFALSKMSPKNADIDNFEYTLTDNQLKTLAEWVMY